MLEVCVDSAESAINAIYHGADELEICSSLGNGGLTPTVGLVKHIIEEVAEYGRRFPKNKKPKLNIMIRCRSGGDFCYTDVELKTMEYDIRTFKELGVDRFVFGALTQFQKVDQEVCKLIITEAKPLPVTFHRAFDMTRQPLEAVEEIISLGFNRLLTSGHKISADDTKALALIKTLVDKYGSKIEIMPGSGVKPENVKRFFELGCKIVHSSCKMPRQVRKIDNDLGMGDKIPQFYTDGLVVKKMVDVIKQCI